jgi:site-specific DNA recombinase
MENKSPLIAAIYIRVSTGRQENEETIDSQLDEVKKRVMADGNVIPEENIFKDDGWTGEMLQRPGLDAMRDAASVGKFQVLYVYDRGRISRVFFHQEIVIEELSDKGIGFISLHDINALTPEEHVLQSMQGVFHQYERIKIAERFRRGKLYKAKNKVIVNGQALYGYTYIRKTETTPAEIRINDDEAEVVEKICRWLGYEGLSIRGIIQKLYKLKIYPRKRKRDIWTKGPIERILKCKTYFDGIAYYNKSEAVIAKNPLKNGKYKKVKRTSRRKRPEDEWIPFEIPVIINDQFLYKRIQKILEDNKKYASKNKKYDYLLTGKTFCDCGYRRVGDGYSKGNNHYYRSAARIYRFPKETDCSCQGVNAVVLDGLFWNKLEEILTTPILLKRYAEKWLMHKNEYADNANNELANLNKKLELLKDEQLRYAKMYGENVIDAGQFEKLIAGTKQKKNDFIYQISDVKKRVQDDNLNTVNVNELCEEAQRVIKSLDTTDRKQVVKDLVEKVIIKKGGDEVETWIHLPLYQAHQMGYGTERRYRRTSKCR